MSASDTSPITRTEVLIVGSGSAGLAAATWLARCQIPCIILEQRPGPMTMGQADGVQCRTVEVMEAFGLSEDLLREAFHVLEVAFWSFDASEGRLRRERVAVDTEPGLSHMPHVILNQARLNGLLIGEMKKANGQDIRYGYRVTGVEVDRQSTADPEAYCTTVVAEKNGNAEQFQAKYVLGCDGAHSVVRRSLGFSMVGDSTDAVWGVMDVYPQTDFPDIRRKSTLRTPQSSALIIPREGGSLVRFYVELPAGTVASTVKLEDLQKQVRQIFAPAYSMEFAATSWWSAYVIGQRQANSFTCDHRVFLTGDACHTHSPKAGQGMNVSLQDGFNIGWKLAAVLRGRSPPELLETYVSEREKVATELINFDRRWTRIFSSKTQEENPGYFSEQFVKAGRYTAGLTTSYNPSILTRPADSNEQALAKNIVVGMRMPSKQAVRFCDAKVTQLAAALPADGRWRLVIFAGDIRNSKESMRLVKLAEYLETTLAPRFTPETADVDSLIEPLLLLSGKRLQTQQEQIPGYFWPVTGPRRMRDLHKIYVDEDSYHAGHGRVYESFGIEPEAGALIVVRPDQHVAMICGLHDFQKLMDFFEAFMIPSRAGSGAARL